MVVVTRRGDKSDESDSFLYRLLENLASPRFDSPFVGLLLAAELALGAVVIRRVAYTEIDWAAYMQEVGGYLAGERDYRKIRGDTGPLVYPAGFLYLYSALRRLTNQGTDIRAAQHLFLVLYLLTQFVVLLLYQSRVASFRRSCELARDKPKATRLVWSWRLAMGLLCCSKRLHSIFLLRLFNDGPAMLLLYASVYLFTKQRWDVGCVVFSLAVSVKMNVLLFAPGLLLLLLQASPDWKGVVRRLGVGCALPQLVLGYPFLSTFPVSYLRKAFELDRIFFYQWTVNWKFLSEEVFNSKLLSVLLLVAHLFVLGVLARAAVQATQRRSDRGDSVLFLGRSQALTPHYITYTLFVSNFVGICFSRTLHYQFYSWYFHALPYLLWTTLRESNARFAVRVLLLVGIEGAFLTFPATPTSSRVLQVCHLVILAAILVHGFPSPIEPLHAKSPGRAAPVTPTKKRV